MARLTREEKYKIQEGLIGGLSEKEIAENINRTVSAVTKYKKEFQEVANTFAKPNDNVKGCPEPTLDNSTIDAANVRIAKLEQQLAEATNTKEEVNEHGIVLLDDVIMGTLHKLRQNGIKKDDASSALRRVAAQLTERIDDPARLHALCMQQLSVHNTMIREAVGGQEGVAVMTSAASQIIDEKKKYQAAIKSERNCLFNPKTGQVT